MDTLVVLDTNVVLANCLGPDIDAKAAMATEVFTILSLAGLPPQITESLQSEFERKLHDRVGQILDAVRDLGQRPAPMERGEQHPLDLLEELFAGLRLEAEESAGALLLLERRIASLIQAQGQLTEGLWVSLLRGVSLEATLLLAEVQKRFDLLGLTVINQPRDLDHEGFRDVVAKSDLEHVAACAAIAKARRCTVLLITLDGPLHARRAEILKRTSGRVVVTEPVYLKRQLQRQGFAV